jgi:transglutaminase-like putative cysteine protease
VGAFLAVPALLLCGGFALCVPPVYGDTIVLEGRLESTLRISKEMRWTVDRPLSELTVELAIPSSFSNRVISQQINNIRVDITPQPAGVREEQDHLGNIRRKVTWRNLRTDPEIKITFDARMEAALAKMESRAPFPLKGLGAAERQYLKSTPLVQVESPEIKALSRELTRRAATEFQAVTAVINYIADNVRYVYNPTMYDAVSTLRDRSGNCSNSAHLSAALLRAAGIPARVVGGTTLDKQLKVPMDGVRSLVQTMGKGGHAWIEVYFPDLGWLSYDPKQSKQFTSTRHVKESHGTDTSEIAESWTGVPYAPAYTSAIDARFLEDAVKVQPVLMQDAPKSYVMSNDLKAFAAGPEGMLVASSEAPPEGQGAGVGPGPVVGGGAAPVVGPAAQAPAGSKPPVPAPAPERPPVAAAERPYVPAPAPAAQKPPVPGPAAGESPAAAPRPPVTPPPPVTPQPPGPARPPAVRPPSAVKEVVLGNMEFPSLVATYHISGSRGSKLLDAETAEYVTSTYVYAQAFTLDAPMRLGDVSLAMHKFGGDGTLYMDVVADDGGKPALEGCRSLPVFLDTFARRPGYSWMTFRFAQGTPETVLQKGKHWIVLRHSGEAIATWFFMPGKSYSGPDDTRSTSKGYQWEDILAYDFVYRVRGVR